MDFYDINCLGKVKIERVSALPTWTSNDEGRILLLTTTQELYIGTTGWDKIGNTNDIYTKTESDNRYLIKATGGTICGVTCICTSAVSTVPALCVRNNYTAGITAKFTGYHCTNTTVDISNCCCTTCPVLHLCGRTEDYTGILRICNELDGYAATIDGMGDVCGRGLRICSNNTALNISHTRNNTGAARILSTAYGSYGLWIADSGDSSQGICAAVTGQNSTAINAQSSEHRGIYANNSYCCTTCVVPHSNVPAGVYGSSNCAIGVCGRSYYNYAVVGNATSWVGVLGLAAAYPVTGNGPYFNNVSSKNVKYTCNICISKCLKDRPLPIYKYTYIDAAQKGYDEFIGPLSEDFVETFDTHNEAGEGEEMSAGLYTLDGIALGLGIENMNKIDKLKDIIKLLTKELKDLKEKINGS